ncbi:hypothetical protein KCP71_14880 [Salmonella enterica subsp. enterica]|nr:hypothetical protein KCP71_14880 [Salmonella enterica subsp. enterica]
MGRLGRASSTPGFIPGDRQPVFHHGRGDRLPSALSSASSTVCDCQRDGAYLHRKGRMMTAPALLVGFASAFCCWSATAKLGTQRAQYVA